MNEGLVRVLEEVVVAYFNIVETKRIPFPIPPISGGEVFCLEVVLRTRDTSNGGKNRGIRVSLKGRSQSQSPTF
jgi:hypothetical protein